MMVELGVVLHDRAEGGHRRRPHVELGARDLVRETGQVPAPEEDATRTGGQPGGDRGAVRVPGRVLVAGPVAWHGGRAGEPLSLIHISEPTRLGMISYAVFCLKKKQEQK